MTYLIGQAELGPFEGFFLGLIDAETLSVAFVVGALAAALGVGAAHALAPGHGKAIAAAWLVGSQGRARHALALGGIVSLMHTGSVLVLGLGLYAATRGPLTPHRVTPWMALASGVLVLAVGVGLVVRHVRHRRGHTHSHPHALPEGVSPLSRRGVVLIGAAGGLLPSPSAFLVLATALFMDRVVFGLALIAAFSLGLAATLTLVGLGAVAGRDLIQHRRRDRPLGRIAAALPLVSSVLVLAAGVWVTATATWRLL